MDIPLNVDVQCIDQVCSWIRTRRREVPVWQGFILIWGLISSHSWKVGSLYQMTQQIIRPIVFLPTPMPRYLDMKLHE